MLKGEAISTCATGALNPAASRIASNSPVATRAAKRALRLGADRALGEALELEHAAWQEAAMSPDRREGIAAFVEKRAPDWPSG